MSVSNDPHLFNNELTLYVLVHCVVEMAYIFIVSKFQPSEGKPLFVPCAVTFSMPEVFCLCSTRASFVLRPLNYSYKASLPLRICIMEFL